MSKWNTVVSVIKCDTSTKTWGIFYDYEKQRPRKGIEIRYLPKRLKFELDGIEGKHSAPFPSAIIIMNRKGEMK